MQNKYGMHIPINCCAKGLKIMHVGPVIMNKNAIVGEDCSFHMNTGLCAGGHSDDAPILRAHWCLSPLRKSYKIITEIL